jgi:hypothetical protein
MRDLYTRLSLGNNASEEKIRAAVSKSGSESFRSDASFVLLDKSRRAGYDRCRLSLLLITRIRSELGLQSVGDVWRSGTFTDFSRAGMEQRARHWRMEAKALLAGKDVGAPQPVPETTLVKKSNEQAGLAVTALFGLVLIIVFSWLFGSEEAGVVQAGQPVRTRGLSSPSSNYEAPPAFGFEALPLPANGAVLRLPRGGSVAPLTIVTRPDGNHLFVKLISTDDRGEDIRVFVRSGKTVSMSVPFGSYELRYAAGRSWYGGEFLFGPDTQYSVAEETFDFWRRGDTVNGYTVELFLQRYGNLETERIGAEDF